MTGAGSAEKTGQIGAPRTIIVFLLAVMLPTAVSLNLGGLRLSAYRMVLIVLFLPMLWQLMSGKKGRFTVFDGLLLAHCLWVMIALINWGGLGQGLESGGIYTIECAGAFLVGRLYIRSYDQFAAVARAYVTIVCATLLFTIPESLTGLHILHDSLSSVFGGPSAPYIDPRMNIERAFGPFDHPILYGVFCASAFSLAYCVVAKRSLQDISGTCKILGVGMATFLSASGGPYLVLILQGFVIAWERLLRNTKGRWAALFSLFVISYAAIDVLSTKTPFHVFVNYLTFSKQSAYNRILLFDYGTAEVARYPLMGVGLGDWQRPVWMSDSIDNFWLVTALRYGLPAFFLLLGLLIGVIWAVAQRKNIPAEWRRASHAWAFTLFGISVAAATVHLWNALFVLFFFLIGSGTWLLDAKPTASSAPKAHPKQRRPYRPHRLF